MPSSTLLLLPLLVYHRFSPRYRPLSPLCPCPPLSLLPRKQLHLCNTLLPACTLFMLPLSPHRVPLHVNGHSYHGLSQLLLRSLPAAPSSHCPRRLPPCGLPLLPSLRKRPLLPPPVTLPLPLLLLPPPSPLPPPVLLLLWQPLPLLSPPLLDHYTVNLTMEGHPLAPARLNHRLLSTSLPTSLLLLISHSSPSVVPFPNYHPSVSPNLTVTFLTPITS